MEAPEFRAGVPTLNTNYISMKDKTSSDLLYGIALDINEDSPEFLPLSVATRALGGSFTARLMRKVRVEDGLTYGVYSSITGTTNKSPGAWIAYGTYSPDLLKNRGYWCGLVNNRTGSNLRSHCGLRKIVSCQPRAQALVRSL